MTRCAVAAIAALLVFSSVPDALTQSEDSPWRTLKDCRLAESSFNDGDSFHITHAGKPYIIRLYFVDTPETRDLSDFKDRLTDQAKYWKINRTELYRVADAATAFTAEKLSKPFTVFTRLEDARGQSKDPRYFGFVQTADGDLAELLVAAGLARIYGYQVNHPDGTTEKRYREKLVAAEAEAKRKPVGAWEIAANKGKKPKAIASATPKPGATPKKSNTPPAKPTLDDIPAF